MLAQRLKGRGALFRRYVLLRTIAHVLTSAISSPSALSAA